MDDIKVVLYSVYRDLKAMRRRLFMEEQTAAIQSCRDGFHHFMDVGIIHLFDLLINLHLRMIHEAFRIDVSDRRRTSVQTRCLGWVKEIGVEYSCHDCCSAEFSYRKIRDTLKPLELLIADSDSSREE